MKKLNLNISSIAISIGIIIMISGCDTGFDAINTKDTAITSLDPVSELNHAMIESSFGSMGRNTLVYEIAIVQQMITPFGVSLAGGNYNQDNRSVTPDIWQSYYGQVIKHLVDVMERTGDVPERSNLYNMARIWRAYAGMVLTDTYGEVPFSEAGIGFIEGNVNPVYDQQQVIYNNILEDLEEASAALDPAKTTENSEILYGGNIGQWKRLGYSLMVRAAMRLTKVDPNTARQYITTAVAGGVMESNEDNAIIRHNSDFPNTKGVNLNGSEAANFYLTKNFVDYLKVNKDPRLASIAIRYPGAESGPDQTPDRATRDTSDQIGMPVGFDNTSIVPVAESDGLASFFGYSQLDRNRLGKQVAPQFLVTHAQTQFLLAEAAVRGWINNKTADAYFEEAIRAHMKEMALHDENSSISESAIDDYIQDHPLEAGRELEQINTQYWVASFLNSPEAFANFRRSGYPDLPPNTYPGSEIDGDFIRRLTYPQSEFSINADNVNEAINRQGPDNLDTRVWWDQ